VLSLVEVEGRGVEPLGGEMAGLGLALGPADTGVETDTDAEGHATEDVDALDITAVSAPADVELGPAPGADDTALAGDEPGVPLDAEVDTDGLGVGDGTPLDGTALGAAVEGQTSAARTYAFRLPFATRLTPPSSNSSAPATIAESETPGRIQFLCVPRYMRAAVPTCVDQCDPLVRPPGLTLWRPLFAHFPFREDGAAHWHHP
jgi:hypothetical protein